MSAAVPSEPRENIKWDYTRPPDDPEGFKDLSDHIADVKRLAKQLADRKEGQMITLQRGKGDSHCPRAFTYKEETLQLDLSNMTGIIGVQGSLSGGFVALVEPRVTMEQLVDAFLPVGLLPPVVPEFKHITVGGSISGVAGESSSYKHGFFHDACVSYEVLLADGSIVTAEADNEHSDLFHAIPGSYGSLGVVTAATMRLQLAKPYVAMQYRLCESADDMMALMLQKWDSPDTDFIEGLAYAKDSYVLCEGQMVDEAEAVWGKRGRLRRFDRFYNRWYYRQVQKNRRKMKKNDGVWGDVVPMKDYIFRHDRGSFWMASYKLPSFIGRSIGFLLSSRQMYRMANAMPQVFDKSEIMLQDFMLPVANVSAFCADLHAYLDLYPLWFCPLKNRGAPGPIFGVPLDNGDYCNVGAYGIPKAKVFEFEADNVRMEAVLLAMQGRKVHYSHAYYDESDFYDTIYNGAAYKLLRDKYKANGAFPTVYDKIITRGSNL